MANYLVKDINYGVMYPPNYIPEGGHDCITTGIDDRENIGTVLAKEPITYLSVTYDEFRSDLVEATDSKNWTSLFAKYNLPAYYLSGTTIKDGNRIEAMYIRVFNIVTSDAPNYAFDVSVEIEGLSSVSIYFTTYNRIEYAKNSMLILVGYLEGSYLHVGFGSFHGDLGIGQYVGTVVTSEFQEIDITLPPNSAKAIPLDKSLLPAPSTVKFGLTLEWDDFSIEDYNVTASSPSFGDSFRLSNNSSCAEIAKGYSGEVIVTITHDIYNLSVTAHYKIVASELVNSDDPYGGSNYTPSGGNGTKDQGQGESDRIDFPFGSTEADDANCGMYTRYLVTSGNMNVFADWLWSNDLGLNVAKTVVSLLYGDPSESLISLVSYPFNIGSYAGSSSKNLTWGAFETGIHWQTLAKNSCQLDWGTVTLEEFWGNFLDYSPFTKIELYLPWGTGFVELDPNQIYSPERSGGISIVTNMELAKGTCVHIVSNSQGGVIGQYSASVGKSLPLISSDFASKQVAMAGTAIGIGAAAATGIAQGISSAMTAPSPTFGTTTMTSPLGFTQRGYRTSESAAAIGLRQGARDGARTFLNGARPAVASASALALAPGGVNRSGSFQEGSAGCGVQYPFIIITRPTQSVPPEYGSHYGYPSNKFRQLGSLYGYTEVGEVHLDGISATEAELIQIDRLLKGGVIL